MGKPEPLTGGLFGYWSQRANGEDRLICRIELISITRMRCFIVFITSIGNCIRYARAMSIDELARGNCYL